MLWYTVLVKKKSEHLFEYIGSERNMTKKTTYDADSISVLEGLEAVDRKSVV